MASLQSVTARARRQWGIAALAVAFLLPAGLGCTSLSKTKTEVAQVLHLEKPTPASQVLCFWQRRPQYLPDPSRDGIMAPGLVGQMFLIAPDNKPVELTGDLVVMATDETRRPPGQPAAVTEVWHIDKATLKKLATKDERFGSCYALFLPWPANWKDVTNVRMQAKYLSKSNPDLWASEVQMTLEFTNPGATVWNDAGGYGPATKPTGPAEMKGIPNMSSLIGPQPKGTGAPAPTSYAGNHQPNAAQQQPGMFMPPPQPGPPVPGQYTTAGPNDSIVTTKTWTGPAPTTSGFSVPTGFTPTISPPPLQQTNFGQQQSLPLAPQQPFINLPQQQPMPFQPMPGQQQPVVQPTFNQLPPALPGQVPAVDANRPWGTQPGPNGGLPPLNIPPVSGSGPLQTVVLPRS